MHMEPQALSITPIKKTIYSLITDGAADQRVLEALWHNAGFIPKETELWDYKQRPSGGAEFLAKTILQIVSFYNTFGGYLVFGVEDAGTNFFRAVGIETTVFNTKQLRDKLIAYTGESIDVTYVDIKYCAANNAMLFGLLHIPKRPKNTSPVYFGKSGPAVDGKLLFAKDQAYIRFQDNCIPATKRAELQLLFSDRTLQWEPDGVFPVKREEPIYNNLPDRNVICSKFLGRDGIIEQLWRWFGDPFAYAKVLAGDGGKGKTSIAYEFAEEICRKRPYDFDKVIWLTGKNKQFIGFKNDYAPMPETHFYDIQSLLEALATELAVLDEEIHGASISLLKRKIKEHLKALPVFVVIDDVDSLDLDHQKMAMESAMQLAGSNSRFLLTTRMNLSYSTDACVNVPGLNVDDYRDLIKVYSERFGVSISSKWIDTLHQATDGSPLFTESLLRLVKLGLRLEEAISKWKGQAGEEVRKAALVREIDILAPESRRMLLALFYLMEASATELRQVTGYDGVRFERCINELMTLFLVTSPPIIKTEARYRVSNNTALLCIQQAKDLVIDPRVIEKEAKALRQSGKEMKKHRQRYEVGIAINQAMALLRDERAVDAAKTIETALRVLKAHPDLLLTKGRCLLKVAPPRLMEARRAFKAAYDNGQRKEILYDLWFAAESDSKHASGIMDVATIAIEDEIGDKSEWCLRRAYGYWLLAKDHLGALNLKAAISDLLAGHADLTFVIRSTTGETRAEAIDAARKIIDEAWDIAVKPHSEDAGVQGFDLALEAIKRGDKRNMNYFRAADALKEIVRGTKTFSESAINFIEQRMRLLRQEVDKRTHRESARDMCRTLYQRLNAMQTDVGVPDRTL